MDKRDSPTPCPQEESSNSSPMRNTSLNVTPNLAITPSTDSPPLTIEDIDQDLTFDPFPPLNVNPTVDATVQYPNHPTNIHGGVSLGLFNPMNTATNNASSLPTNASNDATDQYPNLPTNIHGGVTLGPFNPMNIATNNASFIPTNASITNQPMRRASVMEEVYNRGRFHRRSVMEETHVSDINSEAAQLFLQGRVGPGPNVEIYSCSECGHQFPNAQALGGHRAAHTKQKKARLARGSETGESSHGGKKPKGL